MRARAYCAHPSIRDHWVLRCMRKCLYQVELWFQQDGATCHTARATIDLLKDTFGDRLISRFRPVNWPPRSCDLTPLDYFLWGYVKSLVYADKPQTLDLLEDNNRHVIADIRPQMLEKVIENWTSRLDYIRASRGSPMPEIIFKIDDNICYPDEQTKRFLKSRTPCKMTTCLCRSQLVIKITCLYKLCLLSNFTNSDGEVLAVCEVVTQLLPAVPAPVNVVLFIDYQGAILAVSSNTPLTALTQFSVELKFRN
ncbi:transposable element Tc3 transposase [Trichonephila clavipes]|uniref:Transposable element Tc3 transposase n=1 Tax=Trichonephila clavipes TaxID=2585209 RepID=A0A8X6SVS8_TRICX|nr:transposable element Tc3 transposase [Trichonephila clavipes]